MTTNPTPSPREAIAKVREFIEAERDSRGTAEASNDDVPEHLAYYDAPGEALAALASLESALAIAASGGGKVACPKQPAECDWPLCKCDPRAVKVVAYLRENEVLFAPDDATTASAHRAGQEAMRERAAVEFDKERDEALAQIETNKEYTQRLGRGDELYSPSNQLCRTRARFNERAAAKIRELPLTDNAPGAEAGEPSPRISDKTEEWDFHQSRVIVQEDGRFVAKDKAMTNLPEQDLTLTTHDAALREENARLGRDVTTWRDKSENLEYEYGRLLSDRDALRAQVEELTRERDALRKAAKAGIRYVGASDEAFEELQGRLTKAEEERDTAMTDNHDRVAELSTALAKAERERDEARQALISWAVSRWIAEVSERPLVNRHRRTLDDTWRQVIRYAGGDPVELLGPAHDDLAAIDAGKEIGT